MVEEGDDLEEWLSRFVCGGRGWREEERVRSQDIHGKKKWDGWDKVQYSMYMMSKNTVSID